MVKSGAPLFTTLHPPFTWIFYSSDYAELTEHSCSTDYARIPSGVCLPWGVPADLQSAVKKMFNLWNRGICNPPSIYKQLAKNLGWRVVKSRAHSSPYQISSYTNTYATPVKSEEYFWNWRIIVTSYSGLQIRKEKVEHFLTADCKSAGTPNGRQPPHALQIRWDT